MECKLCWRGKENFWGNELIDTLWNVNLTLSKFLTFSMRINRYIMECKSFA